jgi:hypothetical protein
MPAYKPGGTIDVILDGDANETSPLTFTVTAMSVSQTLDLSDKLEALHGETLGSRDFVNQMESTIKPLIHGWKNAPCDYSWPALLDNLGVMDLWRLANAIRYQIGYREKKD